MARDTKYQTVTSSVCIGYIQVTGDLRDCLTFVPVTGQMRDCLTFLLVTGQLRDCHIFLQVTCQLRDCLIFLQVTGQLLTHEGSQDIKVGSFSLEVTRPNRSVAVEIFSEALCCFEQLPVCRKKRAPALYWAWLDRIQA